MTFLVAILGLEGRFNDLFRFLSLTHTLVVSKLKIKRKYLFNILMMLIKKSVGCLDNSRQGLTMKIR